MPLRSYDPTIARWNRIDPITHHGLSTYNAFGNNPVYYNDPSGGSHHEIREGRMVNSGDYRNDGRVSYNWNTGQYENSNGDAVSFGTALSSVGVSMSDTNRSGMSGLAMLQSGLDTLGGNLTANSCCESNPYSFPNFGGETAVLDEVVIKAVNKNKFPSGFAWTMNENLNFGLAGAYRDRWNSHFDGFSGNYNAGWESWDPNGVGNFWMNATIYGVGGSLGLAGGSMISSYAIHDTVGSVVSNGYASYQAYSIYAYTYVNAYGNVYLQSSVASLGIFYFKNTPKPIRSLLYNKHVYRTLMNPKNLKDIDISKHLFFKGPKVFNKIVRGGAGMFE